MSQQKHTQERNRRLGEAIERAAGELPDGFDLLIEVERGAGTASLLIPPFSDDDPGRVVDDFCGDDLAAQINNAIDMAKEIAEEAEA